MRFRGSASQICLLTQKPNYEAQKAALVDELRQAGIKHNPEQIVRIAKTLDAKIVFLEEGDERRGLQQMCRMLLP